MPTNSFPGLPGAPQPPARPRRAPELSGPVLPVPPGAFPFGSPRARRPPTCLHRAQTGVAEAEQERGAGAAQEGLHPPRPPGRAAPCRAAPGRAGGASCGRGGAVQHRGELRGPVPPGPPGSAGGVGSEPLGSAARLGSARLGREEGAGAAPPSPGSARCSAGQPRSGPSPGPAPPPASVSPVRGVTGGARPPGGADVPPQAGEPPGQVRGTGAISLPGFRAASASQRAGNAAVTSLG